MSMVLTNCDDHQGTGHSSVLTKKQLDMEKFISKTVIFQVHNPYVICEGAKNTIMFR